MDSALVIANKWLSIRGGPQQQCVWRHPHIAGEYVPENAARRNKQIAVAQETKLPCPFNFIRRKRPAQTTEHRRARIKPRAPDVHVVRPELDAIQCLHV